MNAGVPGYSTDQAYGFAVRDGLRLAPDLVLAGVHCSDVSDNYEPHLDRDGNAALARVVADFVERHGLAATPLRMMAIRAPTG